MDHLYDDLDVFEDIDVEYKKVQDINQDLSRKIGFLEAEVGKLNDVVLQMKKQQELLERNISSLYNTAKAECDRKDRQIAELQQRLDDIAFRRTDRRDFRATQMTSRASNRSDSSRSTRHNSRSVSPVHKVRNAQERRVSPRKRPNEGSGPRTPPPPSSGGGKRDSINNGGRDVRNRYEYQEGRSRSRKCTPVQRHRPSESKSPTRKRGRYDGNGRHDNHRSRTPPRRTELAFVKVDRSCKTAENLNNTDQTQKIATKGEVLDVSVEDGEIIEFSEVKTSSVNNAGSNNKCENKKSYDAKHGRRGRQPNAHQKVENQTKILQQVDKIVTEPVATGVKNDQVTLDKGYMQNPPLDETKKREEKPAVRREDDFRLLAVEVPRYPESGKTAPEARLDVFELVKNSDVATQPSPPITSFTGVLSSEEMQRKLFAPKPTTAVAADVLFSADPLVAASRTTKSAPPTIEHPSKMNSSEEPVRAVSRAESKDSASSLDASLHLCLSSDDNKSTCSTNGNTTVIRASPRAADKDNKENVLNDSVVSSGSVAVQSAPAVTAPLVAGKGKARPRRRGGFVKVMD